MEMINHKLKGRVFQCTLRTNLLVWLYSLHNETINTSNKKTLPYKIPFKSKIYH